MFRTKGYEFNVKLTGSTDKRATEFALIRATNIKTFESKLFLGRLNWGEGISYTITFFDIDSAQNHEPRLYDVSEANMGYRDIPANEISLVAHMEAMGNMLAQVLAASDIPLK